MYDLIVIGGGAAGIFGAVAAKLKDPSCKVLLVEKTAVLLAKVRISGGGRCNVTHACFDSKLLAMNYPRGHKELIGPFHRFGPREIIHWFETRGVILKTEKDGRMFPITDSSETIIECLLNEAKKLGIEIELRQKIDRVQKEGESFLINDWHAKNLLLATGSSKEGFSFAESFGHTIEKPIPSLFTFNVPTSSLNELSGISVDDVQVELLDSGYKQRGPLLITHFGFSGPAVIKLSAWAAPFLFEKNYKTPMAINWLPDLSISQIVEIFAKEKKISPQNRLSCMNPFLMPKNLWKMLLFDSGEKKLAETSNLELLRVAERLHKDVYQIDGKTTHKQEFVTCGGVKRSEINFQKMESKLCPGLFFAGEILDIDGVTGGFNFQNAWTTGYIAGNSIN